VRVGSLVPAATEIIAAIGAAEFLVGVSDACDYPPSVRALPRVTRSHVDSRLASGEIARQVSVAAQTGTGPITLDRAMLATLRPDVVIGQGLCAVCAIGDATLDEATATLIPRPLVVTLHAHTVPDVLSDIERVARVVGRPAEGASCVAALRERLERVRARRPRGRRPRVLVLEWVDPPYVAGHWVPELVELAGATCVGAIPGARSSAHPWNALVALAPDVVVVALCGFDLERARVEAAAVGDPNGRRLLREHVEFLDGNSYTSRPGPRLVDAAERLAELLTQ